MEPDPEIVSGGHESVPLRDGRRDGGRPFKSLVLAEMSTTGRLGLPTFLRWVARLPNTVHEASPPLFPNAQ